MRLIPAHAGKTWPRGHRGQTQRAHPRSRGENAISRPSIISVCGSSPLTRGKPDVLADQEPGRGLIPAHAGKTVQRPWLMGASRAHPRSRGENRRALVDQWSLWGSSPLTRGKRLETAEQYVDARLIPAHAGKTTTGISRSNDDTAHPRSRGENASSSWSASSLSGSSPLTRGKLLNARSPHQCHRLIPAHAGKTRCLGLLVSRRTAHPRSRGENASGIECDAHYFGSSPLTRGKR